jgi:hypothetical protein
MERYIVCECESPIVQNEPLVIQGCRHQRMILVTQIVAHEYEFDVLSREAGSNKRNVLCDSVVVAIAAGGRKSFKRRAPSIWNAPLGQVASGTNRKVDLLIKNSKAMAPSICTGFGNERKKQPCCPRTTRHALVAARRDVIFLAKSFLEFEPAR